MKDSWWTFFWHRFLWGSFLIPIIAVIGTIKESDSEALNPAVLGFFVLWEMAVVFAAWKLRVWPFERTDDGRFLEDLKDGRPRAWGMLVVFLTLLVTTISLATDLFG